MILMDDSNEKSMIIPVTFIPYLEKHRIYGFFQGLLGNLIIKRPDDHLVFLRNDIFEFIKQQRPSNSFYLLDGDMKKYDRTDSNLADDNSNESLKVKTDNYVASMNLSTDLSEGKLSKSEEGVNSVDKHASNGIFITKEQLKFSEKVICDWRKICRSNKWFSIRHLSRSDSKDDDHILSIFKKTKEGSRPSIISLSFHTEEKHINETKGSNFYPANIPEEDCSRVRTFNIKLSKDGEMPDHSSSEDTCEHVIGISLVNTEPLSKINYEVFKCDEEEEDDHLKEISRNSLEETTSYIIGLVQETVDEIVKENYTEIPSNISYTIYHEPGMKKPIIYSRGPYMLPRVVILGPPGSANTLQASLLARRLSLIHVDMDTVLLRENQRTNKIPKMFMDVSLRDSDLLTDVYVSVLEKRFLEEDCLKHGWVLTGFPFTASQALALDKLGTSPNRIIYLDKSVDLCRDFLLKGIHDTETGQLCFVKSNPEDVRISKSYLKADPDYEFSLFTVTENKYLMESTDLENATENTDLLHSVARSTLHEFNILKPHRNKIKAIDNYLTHYEASKSMLLQYYGGWCKKLKIDNLPQQRVHEAVVSVVIGPFPSFEEATINDRTVQKLSMTSFSSEIESELRFRLTNFLSDEIDDTSKQMV